MALAARCVPSLYAAATTTALPSSAPLLPWRAWLGAPTLRVPCLPRPRSLVAAAETGRPVALERVAIGLRHRSLLDHDVQADLPALIRGVRAQDASSRHLALLCAPHVHRALDGAADVPSKVLSLALCVRTHLEDPWRVWTELRAAHPMWTPHRDDWAWVVRVLSTRNVERACAVWRELRAHSMDVRPSTLNPLLHALQARPEATTLVDEFGIEALDLVGLSTYVHAHMKADAPDVPPLVHAAAAELQARLVRPDVHDTLAWHALLLYTGRQRGGPAALALAQDAIAQYGFVADAYTVSTLLLAHTTELAALATCDAALALLHRIHTAVRVVPSAHALAMVVRAVLGSAPDPNQVFEAHALYTEARALYHVAPDAALVQPLIDAHCGAFVPDLDRAQTLLEDVLRERTSGMRRRSPARATGVVDLGLFYPLLRACAALHHVPRAIALLRRMRTCGVSVPSHAAGILLRRLGEASRSWTDIQHVYRALHALRAWDSDAWARVLAWVCRWRMPDGTPAPPSLPLQVLADLREAGVHPRPATYTVLLDFCAKAHGHLASVQAVHAVIQRDVQLEPDLVLIHALMNAYNYAGAPAQVLGIFDSLLVLCQNAHNTQCIDDVTLTIVCDTCGRAGLLAEMRGAVAAARALDARLLTKNVWDAWVEGLARCGQLDEAVTAALDEMPRQPATRPDAKTLQTLLKFARARPAVHAAVLARIRAEHPHIWNDALS